MLPLPVVNVSDQNDAFEAVIPSNGRARLLLTCEHASNRLPGPWAWQPEDEWLRETHWAWDIGAAAMTRALAERLEGAAVLARFTRLLVDPNRPPEAPDLFLEQAEGRRVALNRDLTDAERRGRVARYHRPLHAAIDRVAESCRPALLVAIHSFTPVWDGVPREVEVGVLHSDQPELAARWAEELRAGSDYEVRINEPYSGERQLIYSVYTHAQTGGMPGLELELNQRLLIDRDSRAALTGLLSEVLSGTLLDL